MSDRPTRILESIGALTLADTLDRERFDGEIFAIAIPAGPGQLRTHRIKMRRQRGTDLVVRAMFDGGWRGFEPPLPDVFVRVVRRFGATVFDVGANTGFYSLLAVEANATVAVHAFEPFPPVIEMLRDNLALNRATTRVTVATAAVSDVEGELILYVPRNVGFVESSCSLDPAFKDDIVEEIKVPTVTLDRYWERAGRPAVSVVKIDTEGTEQHVFAGAHELVARERPFIFFEVLPRAADAAMQAFGDEHDLVNIDLGVSEALIGRPISYNEHAPNHAFVPVELLAAFVDILEEIDLIVTDVR